VKGERRKGKQKPVIAGLTRNRLKKRNLKILAIAETCGKDEGRKVKGERRKLDIPFF